MARKKIKSVYLDHSASTPLDSRVFGYMRPYFSEISQNPSALYKGGIEAKNALEKARADVARVIGSQAKEVVFTGGATESINLGVLGFPPTLKLRRTSRPLPAHFITTAIEHKAVLECMREHKRRGGEVTLLSVSEDGFVNLEKFKKSIKSNTRLVSIHYANNEIGTIQNLFAISKILREVNKYRVEEQRIYFHTDASQAGEYLALNVNKLGVDLMTLNGGKMYGPKQSGILYVRQGTSISPILFGGGQERRLRSGTENVASVVGFAKALEIAQASRLKEYKREKYLRDYLYRQIKKIFPKVILNGVDDTNLNMDPSLPPHTLLQISKTIKVYGPVRLPNNLNLTFPGIEGEALMLYLDAHGISASTGSACDTESNEPSNVLTALGLTPKLARSTIRFSLGRSTTKKDLDYVVTVLRTILPILKRINLRK